MKTKSEMSAFVRASARVSLAAPIGALVLFQGSIPAASIGARWPLDGAWLTTTLILALLVSGLAGGIVALSGICVTAPGGSCGEDWWVGSRSPRWLR